MSGEQMKSVANIFEQMLAQVLSPGNTAISQLNLLSENDLQRIRQWNSHTPKLYDRTIHDAIHDQALSGPDREAVSAWDGSLTFSELDGLASKLACHLRMQGVGPEVRVALCFDKSVSSALFLLSLLSLSQRSRRPVQKYTMDYVEGICVRLCDDSGADSCKKWNIVAMLGVMKAGGAFVPLDPTHPTSRLQRLIESVKAAVVLCSPSRAEALRPIANTLIPLCADTLEGLSDPAEGVDLASGVTSQNAAYVLFTSGSTGEPKVCFQSVSNVEHEDKMRRPHEKLHF
jgi:non-ribosomal peptide synthetase component F